MFALTPKQRQFLKAKAHSLKPVLQVGKAGVTPALIEELDRVVATHELVKVKLNDNTFEDEPGVVAALTSKVEGLVHVWTIGHTLLLFRPSRERPTRFPLP
ncbi:MAG TPA: ribosome assembly RNA-binding protein YhbY [Holophagaceae bacterium]|jgi:RNA-binding protein|nr:ribosome assembly RNA-binding protein YhbY [Holophagaceae bacterium]